VPFCLISLLEVVLKAPISDERDFGFVFSFVFSIFMIACTWSGIIMYSSSFT